MGRASIVYTNKDYESMRRELLSKIPQLTDRWTDFNHSDLGVVLLELFCGIGDMLAYYLDVQAAEAFLPSARQRTFQMRHAVTPKKRPNDWTAEEKLKAVLEAASLTSEQLGEFYGVRGCMKPHLQQWRIQCSMALAKEQKQNPKRFSRSQTDP